MRSKAVTLVCSVFACLLLAAGGAPAAECNLGGTGKCALTCPDNPNGTLADVNAWGVDARVSLSCPSTGASIGCEPHSMLEPLISLGLDPLLGCRAFSVGNFAGSCECRTTGTLVTGARCSCQ
jgi:hypothetical protein